MNPKIYVPKMNTCIYATRQILFIFLLIAAAGLQSLHALIPGAVTITNKSGPSFILDSNKPCEEDEGPRASYVAYEICNKTAVQLTGLKITLGGLSSGFTLQNGQSASQSIGMLAPGACTMVYWYIKYPCAFDQKTNITITASDATPGTVSATNQVATTSAISSGGAGEIISISKGPVQGLGSSTWIDVKYEFKNIPKDGIAYIQPAGNADFKAGCMQLTKIQILDSEIQEVIPVGQDNALYYTASSAVNGSSNTVSVRYYFVILCQEFETEVMPFHAATSGNNLKFSSNFKSESIEIEMEAPQVQNNCDGDFDNFAEQIIGTSTGLESSQDNWSASWGDYNNDGYPDLFVTTYDTLTPNFLYRNEKDGKFKRITKGTMATDLACSLAATWGDYDNDGDLDLYVANNKDFMCYLYRNEGNDLFVKIQNSDIVGDFGFAHGASWADYDNDGYLDLFVGSYYETSFNLLFHNQRDGTFSKVDDNPIAHEASRTITGVWGDYDNDGWIDLFVVNRNEANNSLYKNNGNGKFTEITTGAIVNDAGNSVGASWGDYDNDGDLDLFVANAGNENNFLYQNNGNGSFTKITGGPVVSDGGHSHGSAWADYDNDGDLDLFVANDGQPNFMYRNDGNGQFTRLPNSNAVTGGNALSFGSAWADFDRDGDLDLFVSNRAGQQNFLYENTKGNCNHWISIKLKGTRSNASGIGAKVFVKSTVSSHSKWQMREISSQTGGGTGGQSDITASFGLGDAQIVDSIIVKWPSGYQQVLTNQQANQFLTITEDNASEVCGTVYIDADSNCVKDPSERGIPNVKVVLQPGDIIAYTDDKGNYSVFVEPGTYGIQEFPGDNWEPNCPNTSGTSAVTVSGVNQQFCGNDFGNEAICSNPDLTVKLATAVSRIGYKNLLVINYANQGARKSSKTKLAVEIDQNMIPILSTIPWKDFKDSHLSWDLPVLEPGEKGTIFVIYLVGEATPIGSKLQIVAEISAKENDCNEDNNSSEEFSKAISSLDPNDLLVSPEGAVSKDEWLTYKIRFQNVGNSAAAWVRVENVLPAGLDLSTFEAGVASHTFQFQATGRQLIWTFPNINLPDSLNNEPESRGFVTFRIKAKSTLLPGDKIINSATIYFDNLEGIATNEVENFIQHQNTGNSRKVSSLDIFPNPASGVVTVQFSGNVTQTENLDLQTLEVYDLQGRPVFEKSDIGSYRTQLDLQVLPRGHYLVKGIDNNGEQYLGKIVLLR